MLFPVVDSVLGQITQEYEKRLLQKDHELSGARDKAAAAQREVAELQVGVPPCCLNELCTRATPAGFDLCKLETC